jgi:uncharacterized membrane protein YkoI
MPNSLWLAGSLALLVATAPATAAQEPAVKIKEDKPGLLAQARITPDSATRLAQARVPGGKIESAEIEMEKGRLIYSYDIRVTGKPGIEEVNVDAKTGKIVAVEHEGAGAEAVEQRADSAKARP